MYSKYIHGLFGTLPAVTATAHMCSASARCIPSSYHTFTLEFGRTNCFYRQYLQPLYVIVYLINLYEAEYRILPPSPCGTLCTFWFHYQFYTIYYLISSQLWLLRVWITYHDNHQYHIFYAKTLSSWHLLYIIYIHMCLLFTLFTCYFISYSAFQCEFGVDKFL
jgi:hypothetical protein